MKNLLDYLFSSKTRSKLLVLFLFNPHREFYVRELTRKLGERINSIRRELNNLTRFGLLVHRGRDRRKYYKVNSKFVLFKELKALVSKANAAPIEKLAKDVKRLGRIKYACLSGIFTQSPSRVDLLFVGQPKKQRLEKFIKKLEREQDHEINYTIMSESEFGYRKDLGDRFLKNILTNEHIVLIDNLKKETDRGLKDRE